MKTMNLTQQAIASYEREEKVMNLTSAIRKFLKATEILLRHQSDLSHVCRKSEKAEWEPLISPHYLAHLGMRI